MSAKNLFTQALDDLHPDRMRRTHTTEGAATLARATKKVPTNKEILDAAKLAYRQHPEVVDSHTHCGAKYVRSSAGRPNVAALNAYDWKTRRASPIAPVAERVHTAAEMKSAVAAARDDRDVWSLVYGISESGQVIVGEEGGLGIAVQLDDEDIVLGEGYAAGKLGLDVDAALNLNLGIWNAKAADLAGGFYGLQVNLDLEVVGVSLGIYLTGDQLEYFGFSVGIGVGEGGGATVVGGYTWTF